MSRKDFAEWHTVKERTEKESLRPSFKEREIWWCSIGINVGHEIDGKNTLFHRPVLVVKKFNAYIFWGVAMTTQIKENPFYFPVDFRGRQQCAMLSHLRLYDAKRLHDLVGTLSYQQFEAIRMALQELL